MLLECDELRIIGCSLSQNDWGLISLLFKTQQRTNNNYEIHLITSQKTGEKIREKNGFLTNIKPLGELDGCQDLVEFGSDSPFEDWLRTKISLIQEDGISISQNLENINTFIGEN